MLDNQEMNKIGEHYDIPVFIDTSDSLYELKVFDEEENTYTILKIDTVARCIKAAFDYEESNYKSCESYMRVTPRRVYYLNGQLVGVFKLHINFAEFHSDCCY
jgi:hypothetical protein